MTAALRVEERAANYAVAPFLTDHLDTFASAPEGFKRLRELVLNLAVRGRLVPQDPSEEPVGVLLSRVAAARTIARKSRTNYQSATEAQVMVSLPQGWHWAALSELATVIRGISYDKSVARESHVPMHVPLLRANNIGRDLNYDQPIFIPESLVSAEQYLSRGDLLIAMSSGSANLVGKAAQVNLVSKHTFGAFCGVVRPLTEELFAYLGLFFQTPMYRDEIARQGKGIGINNVQKSALEALQVPLPPLPEQSRIVAKVEELMALIDRLEAKVRHGETARGKLLDALLTALADSPDAATTADAWAQLAPHFDLLLQTPADVDRLQQTLLTLAVKGRLAPQDPNDEPAAELLKQFVVEERRKRGKSEDEIASDEAPFELPPGWLWVLVRAVSDVAGGIQKTPARAPKHNHYPYLRVANVQRGRLVLDEIERFELLPGELEKRRLESGDILVVEGNGSEKEIGRCALWRGEIADCVHQNHLIRIRPLAKEIANFLLLFLNSEYGRAEMKQLAITTSGLFTLSVGKIETITLPLPPLPEQSRIVAAVASLTGLCDRLRERLAARRELSAKLAAALTESAIA